MKCEKGGNSSLCSKLCVIENSITNESPWTLSLFYAGFTCSSTDRAWTLTTAHTYTTVTLSGSLLTQTETVGELCQYVDSEMNPHRFLLFCCYSSWREEFCPACIVSLTSEFSLATMKLDMWYSLAVSKIHKPSSGVFSSDSIWPELFCGDVNRQSKCQRSLVCICVAARSREVQSVYAGRRQHDGLQQ